MTITALITFIALYCWLGRSWRKDKQFLKDLDTLKDRLAICAFSADLAAQSLHIFGAMCAFYAGMSRATRDLVSGRCRMGLILKQGLLCLPKSSKVADSDL